MLPVQDILPSRHTPHATVTAIVLLGASWGVQSVLDAASVHAWRTALAFSPAAPAPWHAVTTLLLSTGLISSITFALALWIYGDNVEDRLGPWRWATLVATSALVTAYACMAIAPTRSGPIIGAAGAVAGVIGAHLSLFPRMRIVTLVPSRHGIDSTDVPSAVIALAWLTVQGLVGDGTLPLSPLTTLAVPLIGGAWGAVLAQGLARRPRMQVDWWSASASVAGADQFEDRRRT